MSEFYFDKRESRIKPIPDCSRYGLTWCPRSQRCEYFDTIDQMLNLFDDNQDFWEGAEAFRYSPWNDRQMGFAAPAGGGLPLPGVEPISAIVGTVTGIISSLIGGAKQRGSDEARSGVALQASIDGIAYLRMALLAGDITKKEAREAFYLQILPAFLNFISTLTTKSVVESRLKNQRQDLINLYEKSVADIPDMEKLKPAEPSPSPVQQPQDDGTIEYYGDDGSYYYEAEDGSYYYEDPNGEYYSADSEGNLYGGNNNTGEYYETVVGGDSYWESSDGSYYFEDRNGNWSSGDSQGMECSGDAAGGYACSDGSSGGDWRQSVARPAKQQGQSRRQGQVTQQSTIDKFIKQGLALIPLATRKQNNAQRSQTARGQQQASRAQERIIQNTPKGSPQGSADDGMKVFLLGGVVLGSFLLLRSITKD